MSVRTSGILQSAVREMVRLSLQMMLEDPIHDMDMIEDMQENRRILRVQPSEV